MCEGWRCCWKRSPFSKPFSWEVSPRLHQQARPSPTAPKWGPAMVLLFPPTLAKTVSAKGHGMWMLGIGQGREEVHSTTQGCRGLCSMTGVGVVREGDICGEA